MLVLVFSRLDGIRIRIFRVTDPGGRVRRVVQAGKHSRRARARCKSCPLIRISLGSSYRVKQCSIPAGMVNVTGGGLSAALELNLTLIGAGVGARTGDTTSGTAT